MDLLPQKPCVDDPRVQAREVHAADRDGGVTPDGTPAMILTHGQIVTLIIGGILIGVGIGGTVPKIAAWWKAHHPRTVTVRIRNDNRSAYHIYKFDPGDNVEIVMKNSGAHTRPEISRYNGTQVLRSEQ